MVVVERDFSDEVCTDIFEGLEEALWVTDSAERTDWGVFEII